MAASFNLSIDAYATFRLELTVTQGAGAGAPPFNLSGWSPRMQIRPSADSLDVLLDCAPANNRLVVSDEAQGKITLMLPVADTSRMDFDAGVYDLIISNGSDARRLLQGAVAVSKAVTR